MFDASLPWLQLDTQNILVMLGIVMNAILGALIFIHRRGEYVNKVYVFNIACIVLWSIAMVGFRTATTSIDAIMWALLLYTAPTFIASSFLYFTFFFPEEHPRIRYRKIYFWLIAVINSAIVLAVLTPGLVIQTVVPFSGREHIIYFGPFYLAYSAYTSVFFGLGLLVLARKAFLITDINKRRQLIYLLWGYMIASTTAMVANLSLPYLGYFELNWLGQVLTVFMVLPVTYAIFRHRLFDVKVIATELITISLWIFLFVRLLLDTSVRERIIDGALLTVVIIVGILLIRSVTREVEQRELIEEQKKELEQANEEKSEFMTFASHEIRNPLTAMRGYASLIVDGTIGPADVRDAAQKIMVTGNEVIDLISQFLNKSKMELGQLTYAIVDIDLGKLVHDMADRFKPHAKQAGLYFKIDQNLSENYIVSADEGKVKEVVGNIIDNSIKYTKTGGVSVTLSKFADRARIVISDTGAGIPPDVMPYLFQKFSRADAKKLNLFGTGLGLFLARTYMEAMHGKIWAESDGKDKGSRFIIELPLK